MAKIRGQQQIQDILNRQQVGIYDCVDRFSATGNFNRFYLFYPMLSGSESVFLNGIMQTPYDDYTVDNISEHPCVIFTVTPSIDDMIIIKYRRTEAGNFPDQVGFQSNEVYNQFYTYIVDSTNNVQYAGTVFNYYSSFYEGNPNYITLSEQCGSNIFMIENTGLIRGYGQNLSGSLGQTGGTPPYIARSGSYTAVRQNVTLDSAGISGAIEASTGQIFTWGENTNGELGDNSLTDRGSPVSIARPGSYVDLAWSCYATSAYGTGAAIDERGQIWTWGNNTKGTLGIGTAGAGKSSPVSVVRPGIYRQLGGGYSTLLALDSVGRIWGWGWNSFGEIGNGTATQNNSPVSAGVCNAQFVEFAMGNNAHVVALDSSGSLWSWGYNNYGQLGLGDTTNRSWPVSIQVANSFIHVYAGTNWTFAQDHTHVLWCWGRNANGQLGLGDANDRSSPVSVKQL